MTSMPASRSAAATTLAPRSWPSRPGLATRTRMGRIVPINLAGAPLARQLAPACHEQHLARAAGERPGAGTVLGLLHPQGRGGAKAGPTGPRLKGKSGVSRAPPPLSLPPPADSPH